MAEFPYPEYRNLWRGSKLSKDRSALTTNAWSDGGKQVDDGLEVTITSESAGSQSPAYTASGYRVNVVAGETYSLAVPVRNSGAVQFPVKISAYFDPSGGENSGVRWISPGETTVIKIENMVAPNDGTIRFSWRVDTNDPRPPVGGKLVLLDGVTLVQSATVPDFLFNGDGAKPVETVLRRNVNPNPSFEEDLAGYASQSVVTLNRFATAGYQHVGQYGMAADVGENAPALTWNRGPRFDIAPGQWFGSLVHLRTSSWVRTRVIFYNAADTVVGASPYITTYSSPATAFEPQAGVAQAPATAAYGYAYFYPYSSDTGAAPTAGTRVRADAWLYAVTDTQSAAEAAVASYFDGDTPPDGSRVYRWAPDGTSLEIEVANPPTGRTYVWDGEPYKSTSTAWVGDSAHATGVMDVGIATEARLGIVSDIYSRSREKIQLELARVDSQLIAGERVELDAAAMTASPVVWHWRQITGPTVVLEPREASLDFIAPDVDEDTTVRIAVYAASEDGRNRSDWHYFDLTIKPPMARFRASESVEFEPVSPKYVGYDRGKREIWNDVIPPSGFSPNARHETEIIDLGILPDDVQFTTDGPPEVAAAGGIYVDLETGDIYRNFGAGYNETDDTTAAPRTNAWWVNPATGDILEWIED